MTATSGKDPAAGRRHGLMVGVPKDGAEAVMDVFLRVLVAASLGVALASALLGPMRIAAVAAANAAVDAIVLLRLRRGRFDNGPFIVAVSLWAVITYSCFWGRGTHDIGMVVLGVLMMVAAMLQRLWQSVLIVALSLLGVWAMGIGEITGHFRHGASHLTYWDDMVVLTIIFATCVALMRVVVGRWSESVALARATERNYKEIFNATHEGILVLACEDGRILEANAAATAALGAEGQPLRGRAVAEAMGLPSEDVVRWLELCHRNETINEERQVKRAHGKPFWSELSLRSTRIDGHDRVLVVLRDIDARHRLQEELRQADKLRALGQLAGGVAHDFNNQLTGILANAELVKLEVARGRGVSVVMVDSIIKCAMRSADLTRQLLAFARKARPRREDVDVLSLVREVMTMLERGLRPGITLTLEGAQEGLVSRGDPSLLQNAILNLGLNGKDAMPQGGTLRFGVSAQELAAEEARALDIPAGPYVIVSVEDTGVGMEEQTRTQIFEPFFTTKESGTGMGLAAAYGTVRGHGGALTVDSEVGKGSRFALYLPRAEPGRQSRTWSALPAVAGPSMRVLVVDDEPEVAVTTVNMLKALGHVPRMFNSPLAALKSFEAEAEHVDFAVLDRLMPDLSGDVLLAKLRTHKPGLPAVIVSGYGDAQGASGGTPGRTTFLPKPFGPHDLQRAMARVLAVD